MNNSSISARQAENITIGNTNSSIRFDFIAGNIIMDNNISNVYYGLGAMNVHINDFCQNLYLYRLTSCTIAPQCQNISINSAENTTIDSSCTNLIFDANIKNMQIGAGVKNMEFNYATGVSGTLQNVIIRPGVAFAEGSPKIVTLQSTDLGLDETTIYQKGPDKVVDLA